MAFRISSSLLPSVSSLAFPKIKPVNNEIQLRILKTTKEVFRILAAVFICAAAAVGAWAFGTPALIAASTAALGCFLATLAAERVIEKIEKSESQRLKTQEFCHLLLNRVKAHILYNSQYKDKEEIIKLLDAVKDQNLFIEKGSDQIRVKFVGSQGAIEHVLACAQTLQELTGLIGAIHTPLPATPLCTRVDSDVRPLLDSSIAHDLDKLMTVKSRAEVVREYLEKGGKLYIIYPQGGLEKRSSAEQEIYKEELKRYPNLIDCVLQCSEMDPDMVGATYLFRDRDRNIYSFSIKARQANDIQKEAEWGIWLGILENPIIKQRVHAVFDYIKSHNGPDIEREFFEQKA